MIVNLLNDSIKLFLFKLVQAVGWLTFVVFLTRILLPSEYGLFWLIYSTILLGTIVSTSWITSSVLRFYDIYEKHMQINDIVVFSLKIGFINTFLVIFLILVTSSVFNLLLIPKSTFILTICWFIIYSIYSILITFLRPMRKIVVYGFFNMWQILGGCLIALLLINYFNQKINAIIIGFILAQVSALYFLFKNIKKNREVSEVFLKINYVKEAVVFWKYGYPIVILNIFSQGLSNADKYIITFFHGSNFAGIYSASYSLAEQSIFAIISVFSTVSIPIFFKLWNEGNTIEINLYLNNFLRFILLTTIPILIIICLIYKELASILIDSKFSAGFFVIPLASLGAFFVALSIIYTDILTASKQTSKLMLCYLFAFGVNTILNLILIPKFLLLGAVISSIFAYISLFAFVVFYSRKVLKWTFDWKLIKDSLLATMCTSVLSFILFEYICISNNLLRILFFSVFVCVVFYFISFLNKQLNLKEIKSYFSKSIISEK